MSRNLILSVIILCLLIGLVLIPVGVGIGYLLSACLGIELGHGVIAGSVFMFAIAWTFARLLDVVWSIAHDRTSDDCDGMDHEEDDEDDQA